MPGGISGNSAIKIFSTLIIIIFILTSFGSIVENKPLDFTNEINSDNSTVLDTNEVTSTRSGRNQQTDEWPMFRHDMRRTGNTTSKAPNTNNIIWTHQTAVTDYTWGYCGSPTVDGGLVFQGSNRPDLIRAINTGTGIQSWSNPVGMRITSSASIANNRVVYGAYDKFIYSVNQATGAEVWKVPVNNYPDSSPTIYNNKVYIGDGQGDYVADDPSFLYCFDETTGALLWTFPIGAQIVSSPTVVNDVVIFGSYDGFVYAVPANDPNNNGLIEFNEIIWRFYAGSRIVASAAVVDGIVYIGDWSGKLYALPFTDPIPDGEILEDEVLWVFETGNQIWSSVGVASGRVFVGSHDHYVYALPAKDPDGDQVISINEVLWKYKTTDKIWSSPAIAGGKIFITSEDYTIWALTEETGALVWNYIMPLQEDPYGSEYLYSSPAIVDGKIYVGNFDLTLYCFGSEDDTPPIVTAVEPADGSADVPLNTDIKITFDEDMVSALIMDTSIVLESSKGAISSGRHTFNPVTRTFIFDSDTDLQPNEQYTVSVRSKYFQDSSGNTLDGNGDGISSPEPEDNYIWSFNTNELVGHKPTLKNSLVTPETGYLNTMFEFRTAYYDLDNEPPWGGTGRYIKLFIDDSINGIVMKWANGTNTPDSYLLDGSFTNGELFRARTHLNTAGTHSFFIECSDGSNTNRSEVILLPTVLNAEPVLSIPDQYVKEGQKHQLDLSPFVSDIDNTTDSLKFTEDSQYCTVESGNMLSSLFTKVETLSHEVNITVSDGINSVTQKVLFVIIPSNDAPEFKPGYNRLPPVNVYEDTLFYFDLSEFITDSDTPLDLLEVQTDSPYITSSGLNLYLRYPYSLIGENATLIISDGSADLITYLDVTVIQLNDAPVLNIPSIHAREDLPEHINIGLHVTDEESVPSELDIKVHSEALGDQQLINGLLLLITYPEGVLSDYLNVTVVDGNITVYQIVRVTVTSINDKPLLFEPKALSDSDNRAGLFNFTVWYEDQELKSDYIVEPQVELILNGQSYAMVTLEQTNSDKPRRLYGIILNLAQGAYQYKFQCDDVSGETNSRTDTELKALQVKAGSTSDKDDDDSGTGGLVKKSYGGIQNWVWIVIFIIIIIVFFGINFIILRIRKSKQPHTSPLKPPVVESLPQQPEPKAVPPDTPPPLKPPVESLPPDLNKLPKTKPVEAPKTEPVESVKQLESEGGDES